MQPHFASTLYVVRQMSGRSVEAATAPVPSRPDPSLPRPKAPTRRVVLSEASGLAVVLPDGRALLEIVIGDHGPELRLVQGDLRIEGPEGADS